MALNRATGRMFPVSNPIVKRWQNDVAKQLLQYRQHKFIEPVSIVYKFYCGDNRRRDIDNMIASINDALVKSGLIVDDDWKHLSIGSAEGEYDKDNPRAELWIDPLG